MESNETPAVHNLKTVNPYFADVKARKKRFEIRKDDRNVQPGDYLRLQEWNNDSKSFSGNEVIVRVNGKLKDVPQFGLKPGFAIFDLQFHEELPDEQKVEMEHVLLRAIR